MNYFKGADKLKLLIENLRFANVYFSQTGEDIILKDIFAKKEKGFYIDVGAHHPERLSNTKLLYEKGWRGINIDAHKESIKFFEERRKRDINICAGISDETDIKLIYRKYEDPARNTFSEDFSASIIETPELSEFYMITLKQILDTYLPKNQKIDFLSVDCEGNDLRVLKSNDWNKYRPEYVLIEMFGSPEDKNNWATDLFLKKQSYVFLCKTNITAFYKKVI